MTIHRPDPGATDTGPAACDVAALPGMEIGPVRRRFTAEPATSPVPGEAPAVHEPSAVERAPVAPDQDAVPTTSVRSDRRS